MYFQKNANFYKDYSGSSDRMAHFMLYNALLFASNANDLNIGLITHSVSSYTQIIGKNYFNFTSAKFYIDEDYLINKKKEKRILIKKLNNLHDYIKDDISLSILSVVGFSEYIRGYNESINTFHTFDTLYFDEDSINSLEKEIKNKKLNGKYYDIGFIRYKIVVSFGHLDTMIETSENNKVPFNDIRRHYLGDINMTDILYIRNKTFLQKMDGYAKKIKQCPKTAIKGDYGKDVNTKQVMEQFLNISHINKIFS
jgi:hypothetical protein